MANGTQAGAMREMRAARAAAEALGLEVRSLEIRRMEDIAPGLAPFGASAGALYVCADPLVNTSRSQIIRLASIAGMPTIFGERENVDDGGLISYGPSAPDLYRRAAELVDKILRGAKPGDIPVEQPTKFELVINLKTAKALGLTVPDRLLALADEVIE
jgi:putative tryptophan/tyrosine transport system substrate-binding protein